MPSSYDNGNNTPRKRFTLPYPRRSFPQLKDKVTGRSKAVAASSGSSAMPTTRSARRAAADNFWGRLVRAVPFQKLKILIVVWQILTQVRGGLSFVDLVFCVFFLLALLMCCFFRSRHLQSVADGK